MATGRHPADLLRELFEVSPLLLYRLTHFTSPILTPTPGTLRWKYFY